MSKTFACPKSKEIYNLPPNLLTHQRNTEGKWRYKGPDGVRDIKYYIEDDSSYIEVTVAIDLALRLNQKHYGTKPNAEFLLPAAASDSVLLTAALNFFEEYEAQNPTGALKNYWKSHKIHIRRFVFDMHGIPSEEIDIPTLSRWLQGIEEFAEDKRNPLKRRSYHSQKGRFFAMTSFIDFCIGRKLLPNLEGLNPFRWKKPGSFKLPEVPDKVRSRLEWDEYKMILRAAIADGCDWFVLALKLGLTTKLRIGDLTQLTFDNWDRETNILYSGIRKAISQKGEENSQINTWGLDDHPQILNYLNQALATRNNVATNNPKGKSPAIHILHRRPKIVKESKDKTHYAQIIPRDITGAFRKYSEAVPRIAELPSDSKERPTFHELRSLGGRLEIEQGIKLEDISQSLAHSGLEITKNAYLDSNKGRVIVVGHSLQIDEMMK